MHANILALILVYLIYQKVGFMSHTPEELLFLTTRFEKQAHKFQKPYILRLIDQLKDAIRIGDEETIKEIKEAIEQELPNVPNFKYVK